MKTKMRKSRKVTTFWFPVCGCPRYSNHSCQNAMCKFLQGLNLSDLSPNPGHAAPLPCPLNYQPKSIHRDQCTPAPTNLRSHRSSLPHGHFSTQRTTCGNPKIFMVPSCFSMCFSCLMTPSQSPAWNPCNIQRPGLRERTPSSHLLRVAGGNSMKTPMIR